MTSSSSHSEVGFSIWHWNSIFLCSSSESYRFSPGSVRKFLSSVYSALLFEPRRLHSTLSPLSLQWGLESVLQHPPCCWCTFFFLGVMGQRCVFPLSYCSLSCFQRKPLFIYLHHDHSVAAHIFCNRLLCSQQMNQFMEANQLKIWPWDVTLEGARTNVLHWMQPRLDYLATEFNQMQVLRCKIFYQICLSTAFSHRSKTILVIS